MSTPELIALTDHALIVIGAFILYVTGRHLVEVCSEMRKELSELRGLIKKLMDVGDADMRAGATTTSTEIDEAHSPSTEKSTVPPG